jgi:hypothetical protein
MPELIEKGDPLHEKLMEAWIAGGKAGTVTLPKQAGRMFRVLRPSDEEIKFVAVGSGVDDYYGSGSGTL